MNLFRKKSHYDWLQDNLQAFYTRMGLGEILGTISCHGDKCYSYRDKWKDAGIPFPHGVAIYFLTYERPFQSESRQVNATTWVDPWKWVIDNYDRFKPLLNPVSDEYE